MAKGARPALFKLSLYDVGLLAEATGRTNQEVMAEKLVVRCRHGNIDPHPWCPDKSHLLGAICDDPDWCPGSPTLAEPGRAPNRWDEPPEAAQG